MKLDPEGKKEAVLNAAEKLFLEKGFGSTSISMIAEKAGITKSLIHHYFESKEGLWEEVKERRFKIYAEQQDLLFKEIESKPELLVESMKAHFNFLKDNPEISRLRSWVNLEDETYCRAAETLT